jgi:hypothetical protein
VKVTALSNHKPGILNNYIRMYISQALKNKSGHDNKFITDFDVVEGMFLLAEN